MSTLVEQVAQALAAVPELPGQLLTDTVVLGHPAVLLTLKAPCNGVEHVRAIRASNLRSSTYVSPSTGDWMITVMAPQ